METTIACAGSNTEESSSQNDKLQTMRNSTDEHQHPTPSQKQHQSPPQQHPPPYSSAMLDAYTRLPSYDEALKDSGSEKHEQGTVAFHSVDSKISYINSSMYQAVKML